MSSSLLNIASTGLKAAQVALSTTSNNISNAYVDGYNRQSATLSESSHTSLVGTGVTVTGVSRAYDSLVVGQLRSAASASAASDSYYNQITQVDNLLSDSDTDLSTQLSTFFSSLQSLSSNANDSAARQTVIGSGQSLVNQFQSADSYLRDMDDAINQQLGSSADQINNYAQQIAALNNQISRQGSGDSSNALLDQRDQLINNLNSVIGVNVSIQDNNTVSLTIGKGLTLVQGGSSYQVKAVSSDVDAGRTTLAYDRGNGVLTDIDETTLTGGSIGGLLSFRSSSLDDARNQLGQIALSLADSFNTQHASGVDLNGDSGQNFFTLGSPTVSTNTKNSGDAQLSVNFADSSAVKASDYSAKFTDGNWQITRLSDGNRVAYTSSTDESGASVLAFDGLTMSVDGTAKESDSFRIHSVANVISGLSVAITDPALIAAGQAGDDSGDSDNRNAQALIGLQSAKLVGGSATLGTAYASMVSNIGTKTKNADVTNTAQSNMVTQLTARQQSLSGVNLDEEYVDLQRYQQYYQANAKVLNAAGSLFDSLLSAIA